MGALVPLVSPFLSLMNSRSLSARVLAAALLLAPFGIQAARPDPEVFFKPGPEMPAGLSAERLFPKGRLFPFSFFSVGGGSEVKINELLPEPEVQKEFAHYKTLGIPLFGPQYELNERSLADAEQHDLKVAYTVGLPMKFHDRTKEGGGPLTLTPEEITQEVTQQVKAVVGNPRVALWYLRPEELRPWRKAEMAYLEAASKAIRAADPEGRPIWIYDPAHASAKRMAAIAPWVDFVGKGMYTNYVSQQKDRIFCRWTIEQEQEAIRLAGAKAYPVSVPEMFRQPEEADLPLIPTWVRHDLYLSLVSGAKGVFVFSARRRPNFPAREAYLSAYAAEAPRLLGPLKLGELFLFGEAREDLVVDVTDGPATVSFIYPSGGVKEAMEYPSLTYKRLALGGRHFLFIVNSAQEPVEASVGGLPFNALRAVNVLEPEAPAIEAAEGEFPLRFAPLEVKIIEFQRK